MLPPSRKATEGQLRSPFTQLYLSIKLVVLELAQRSLGEVGQGLTEKLRTLWHEVNSYDIEKLYRAFNLLPHLTQ